MSDRLEEIKKHRVGMLGFPEDIDWLIAEVERLYQNQLDRNEMELEMEGEIESLTKERDEARQGVKIHEQNIMDFGGQISKLEAENDTIKRDLMFSSKRNAELNEKLAASEKERRIKKLWNIAIKCNLCGAVFPDKHKGPCAL